MDRIIEVKVFGNHLTKDNKNAGTKGEANVTKLRVTFNEGWDSYAKEIIFWDAYGENAVRITLTTNLLENIENSTRVYIVPIPTEAMARAGLLTFSIKGYLDGKRQVSTTSTLEVKDSPDILEPIDPTPTQAEQLQVEVDKVKEQLQGVIVNHTTVVENANKAEQKAKIAEECAIRAETTVGKTSYIGDNGNWYAWDEESREFYDTGVKAQAGSTVYLGDNPPPEADVWVNPNEVSITEDYTQDEKQKLSDLPTNMELQSEFATKLDKATYERDKAEIEETIFSYGTRIGVNEDNIVALEDMIIENTEDISGLKANVEHLDNEIKTMDNEIKKDMSNLRNTMTSEVSNAKEDAKRYADIKVADIVNSSPDALDTLKELANALGNDPEFATTVLNLIGAKVDKATYNEKMSSIDSDIHSNYQEILALKDDMGAIDSALLELHNYAQTLISGGAL